nr:hypothetical protein [Tanacetum cinerariifolium]
DAQLKALIDQGGANALAARDADRSRNGEDNHDSGMGVRRQAPRARECTYQEFMKCKPLYFKGTEGVVELTQWFERMETNSYVMIVCPNVAYATTWTNLRKKMTDKYCTRGEIKTLEGELWNLRVKSNDVVGYNQRFQELALLCVRMFPEESDKVERYVSGLPDMIHGSVVASRPKKMQEVIEMATELMDKRNNTFAKRQAEKKQKFDDTSKNNNRTRGRISARLTLQGLVKRNLSGGSKPLCLKCNYHHDVQKPTFFECGAHGYFKRECPKVQKNNRVNQAGNGNAPAKVYAVRGSCKGPEEVCVLQEIHRDLVDWVAL